MFHVKHDFFTSENRIQQKENPAKCGVFSLLHCNLIGKHVTLQSLRNADAAILIQVVFEECDQHSRRCHNGVVQCMCEILLAVCALHTDTKASCLCVTEVGAAADFEILLLTGRPCLNVDGLLLQIWQIAGAAL